MNSANKSKQQQGQAEAQRKNAASRFRDSFPFTRDLSEYPITRESQYPAMPVKLQCVESDLHLCFEVLMSDGTHLGDKNNPRDYRLDAATVEELGGLVPEKHNASGITMWGKFDGVSSDDLNFDIELTPDLAHPLNLLPHELAEYARKVQIIFKRSTTPKDDPVSDFSDI